MNYWILDTWLVHPGREDAFIAQWTDLMQWSTQEAPGRMGSIPLYRDLQQPNRFFCPMAWDSTEAITDWRTSQGYQQRLEQIEHLCVEREARILVPVTKLPSSDAV